MKLRILALAAFVTLFFVTVNIVGAQEGDCCKNKNKSESECKSKEQTKDCSKTTTDCTSKTGNSSGIVDSAKVCVVTGEVLGEEGPPVYYTYLGKEYAFCCAGCVKKFKAEPMKYIKEEIKCPVMGEAASKDVSTVVDGVKYYFCCESCIKKFEKDPQKYLNK
jgi:YHS domain-containing protein